MWYSVIVVLVILVIRRNYCKNYSYLFIYLFIIFCIVSVFVVVVVSYWSCKLVISDFSLFYYLLYILYG